MAEAAGGWAGGRARRAGDRWEAAPRVGGGAPERAPRSSRWPGPAARLAVWSPATPLGSAGHSAARTTPPVGPGRPRASQLPSSTRLSGGLCGVLSLHGVPEVPPPVPGGQVVARPGRLRARRPQRAQPVSLPVLGWDPAAPGPQSFLESLNWDHYRVGSERWENEMT